MAIENSVSKYFYLRSSIVLTFSIAGYLVFGLDPRKPVFGVSDKTKHKQIFTATETSQKIEISLEESLIMISINKRIAKALIRRRGCAGWSAPLLFATPQRHVFLRRGPNYFSLHTCSCLKNMATCYEGLTPF